MVALTHEDIIHGADSMIADAIWPLNERIMRRCELPDDPETGALFVRALKDALAFYRERYATAAPDGFGFVEYYTYFAAQEIERQSC